jgi:hypothetical protein
VNIIDLVQDGEMVEVTGFGNPPVGDVRVVRRDSPDFWDFLNFLPTIGDFRNFWQIRVPAESPVLYLRGEGGFPFRQELYLKEIPKKADRVFLSPDQKTSTYASEVKLEGRRSDSAARVASRQSEALNFGEGKFEWRFAAPKKGAFNRATLQVRPAEAKPGAGGTIKPWRAYSEIYRAYPGHVSGRGTTVVGTDGSVLVLAEASAAYHFEDLFGWQNRLLSVQRWALAARHFQSIVTLNSRGETEGESVDLSVTNMDLRYRISPGVWGRDATVGLVGGLQAVNFVGFNVQMAGGGAFWARSMPEIFDRVFNILPFMRYPKWVDMELLWYPVSLSAGRETLFTFALNLHGKVQWSQQWFGEAGFGFKNFNWKDLSVPGRERQPALGVGYASMGIGYQF